MTAATADRSARHGDILAAQRLAAVRQATLFAPLRSPAGRVVGDRRLDLARFIDGGPRLRPIVSRDAPASFGRWQEWIKPLADTFAMSIAGTALAVVISLPLALLSASNTSPHPVVYQAFRTVLSALRSVPELIMGIIFVAAVGFGALPGVLALALHSTGMVAKFYSEAIEHVDARPIEAARAAGASAFQVITHAVLPQVLPQLADITIYRWEYHFRASTVLGIVGAGGIGFELIAALRIMKRSGLSDPARDPPVRARGRRHRRLAARSAQMDRPRSSSATGCTTTCCATRRDRRRRCQPQAHAWSRELTERAAAADALLAFMTDQVDGGFLEPARGCSHCLRPQGLRQFRRRRLRRQASG